MIDVADCRDAMMATDALHWLPLYVRWEAGLLEALGFGLDLSVCAATGQTDDLVYVSPGNGHKRAIFTPHLTTLPPS